MPVRRDRVDAAVSRLAVRVVLFDQFDHILLVRFWDGDRSWWCAPGGGVEDGESHEDAARRELREEVGLCACDLGPWIWRGRHVGIFRGEPFDQRERYVLARTSRFEPVPAADGPVEHGRDVIRWWSVGELRTGPEAFAPRRLPGLVASLLADGPPLTPIDVGV